MDLTQKVLEFQQTNNGLDELIRTLSPRVYQDPRVKLGWDEDACGDFYVFFRPRLVRLLSRFKDQGKPFESYLCSVLNWQLKNFARERRIEERGWNVVLHLERLAEEERAQSSVMELEASAAGRNDMAIGARGAFPANPVFFDSSLSAFFKRSADRRNFLLLCLKCVRLLPAERLQSAAAVAGIPASRMEELAAAAKASIQPKEKRLESFRLRRNRAYAAALLLEVELSEETDPGRRERLTRRLDKARTRMRTAMWRMSRMMLNPTNREIAAVLGIPKGTVDSGLYWLKKRLAEVYDADSLRSA